MSFDLRKDQPPHTLRKRSKGPKYPSSLLPGDPVGCHIPVATIPRVLLRLLSAPPLPPLFYPFSFLVCWYKAPPISVDDHLTPPDVSTRPSSLHGGFVLRVRTIATFQNASVNLLPRLVLFILPPVPNGIHAVILWQSACSGCFCVVVMSQGWRKLWIDEFQFYCLPL